MDDSDDELELKNSTIHLSISVVSAFSVEAIVSVSTPSHVWCEALKQDHVFDEERVILTDHRQYISSKNIVDL